MNWNDFKKTFPDIPFTFILSGRESGKTTIQRKRLEKLIETKSLHDGTITKIEIDEFIKRKGKKYDNEAR